MQKKWYLVATLLLLVVPAMLGNISWANDVDNTYTIEAAIDKALAPENPTIKELEWKEEDAYNSLSSAISSQSTVNKSVYPEEWYRAYSSVRVAQANLEIARRAKELSTTLITLQVKQAYFDALLAGDNVGLVRKKLNQTEEQYRITKSRYDKNLISNKDFLSAKVNLAASQTSLTDIEQQKELAYLNLKDLMNLDFDQNLVLTSKLNYEPMVEINPRVKAQDVLEENSNYLQTKAMLEAYEDIKKEASIVGSSLTSTNTYANADKQVEKLKNQLVLTERKVELAVYKAYVNLKKSEDKLKNINKQIELAEEVAKIARLSYKAGTGTLIDANDALIKLDETKLDYQKALHAYNTAKASFEVNIF